MQKTIALLASHFEVDFIPPYLKTYLSELKKASDHVILIHTHNELPQAEKDWLLQNNIQLVVRANKGYDFASWYEAIQSIDTSNYSHYILANDSCLCIQPLKPILQWYRLSNNAFSGLINSNERKPHIQSFFMMMNKKGIDVFMKSFDKYGYLEAKNELINKYEIGLTQMQKKAGNKMLSYLQVPSSNKSNPMFHQTKHLIETGFPLVKRQLVFNTLAPHDIDALKSAGIYTGNQVVKDAIVANSGLDINWDEMFT
jgi:lipopolysaccharide biosynthesis protein